MTRPDARPAKKDPSTALSGLLAKAMPGKKSKRPRPTFKFRLYVAGDAINSTHAITNLTALCKKYLPQRHEIEVIDVFVHPERALFDGIFMTPTLVKFSPDPARSIVGTLSQLQNVLLALGLAPQTP